jgi:hypothetical protein
LIGEILEDVVGIKVRDKNNGLFGFMTWGRLWDPVDDTELLRAVRPFIAHCQGIEEIVDVEVCYSLRDVQHTPYFYEALISFSWGQPQRHEKYKRWRKDMRKELERGRQIYFLGPLDK